MVNFSPDQPQARSWVAEQILTHLANQTESLTLIDLAALSGASYSAISIAARVLVARGVVERRKEGKYIVYRLVSGGEVNHG